MESIYLFSSLSTQRNSIDSSKRPYLNIILFDYETHVVNNVICIPRSTNTADLSAQKDSSLTNTLQLLLLSEIIIQLKFHKSEYLTADHSLG